MLDANECLTNTFCGGIIPAYGLVAQLGAHHIRIVGVGSSNLLKSTNKNAAFGRLFLLVDLRKRFEWFKCNTDERCPLRLDAVEP